MSATTHDTHYKALVQPVQPHLMSVCPSMDLVAAVTAHNQLEVFRFDGQRAFGWRRGTAPLEICALQWSATGAFIALAWSDDTIEIVDAKLGKVVLQYPLNPPKMQQQQVPGHNQEYGVEDTKKRSTRFIGWGLSLLDPDSLRVKSAVKRTAITRPVRTGTHSPKDAFTVTASLEDYSARVPDPRLIEPEGEATSLPLQLVQMDLETELPQLSALPQVEDPLALDFHADRFASQELVDARLPLSDLVAGPAASVPIKLACSTGGALTSFIYEGFSAGVHNLNAQQKEVEAIAYAWHPFSSTQVVLASSLGDTKSSSEKKTLSLQAIDYKAIRQSKHYIHIVYTKVSTLLELSRYASLTIVCLRAAWSACQDLPQRWISNGREMFTPEHKTDLITAMYRLVVTGDCHPLLKEWLKDDIGERNYKRWDAAVTTNYTKIIELVQRHLLPVLDRITIVASRLRALARTPDIPVFKLDERHLTRIMHDTDVLRLIAYRVMQYARVEAIQFATFSTWLATQTALQAAEPNSTTALELAERAAEIDPAPLLYYILGAMTRSKLNFFLSRRSAEVVDAPRRAQQQIRTLPLLAQILDRHAEKATQPGSQPGVVEIVDLLYQALFLGDSVREVYAVVPTGLAKGTIIGKSIDIVEHTEEIEQGIWDVRMVHKLFNNDSTANDFQVYTVHVASSENSIITVQHRSLSISTESLLEDDPVTVRIRLTSSAVKGTTSQSTKVLAVKFLDDQDLVALLCDSETQTSCLVRACYSDSDDAEHAMDNEAQEATALQVIREWDHEKDNFKPRHLLVSKEKQRVRCVCLDEGQRRYGVVAFNDGDGQDGSADD